MDHHDTVARLCTAAYLERLPGRGSKPTTRSNGVLEWTVLAGFVISYPDIEGARQYSLISLATGQKSIPYARAAKAHGDLIHDCHAEVLARRGARHWLSTRLQAERTQPADNRIRLFETVDATRSRLRKGIELHLYVSTLPCGDASSLLFEFQRAKQDVDAGREEAVTPFALLDLHSGAAIRTIATSSALSRGRAGAQRASGHLRTKPGRPDSPPSISMSCSDKLALWSAVGIQGSLLSSVIEAVHINSVTISDGALISIGLEGSDAERLQAVLRAECVRSLNRAITNRNPVEVAFTTVQFIDSKESVEARASIGTGIASASGSVLYIANPMLDMSKDVVENLVAGTKLGASTKRATQSPFLLKPAARSAVCKLSWWTHVSSVLPVSPTTTYWDAKRTLSDGTQRYRAHKQCLIGARSSEQLVNAVNDFLANTNTSTTAAPQINAEAAQEEFKSSAPVFEGWLVSPPFIEHFKRDGSRV